MAFSIVDTPGFKDAINGGKPLKPATQFTINCLGAGEQVGTVMIINAAGIATACTVVTWTDTLLTLIAPPNIVEGVGYRVEVTLYGENIPAYYGETKADTFADLRTIEPTIENQVITLIGHTVAGIGGGTFRAVLDGSGLTDDNGVNAVTVGGAGWIRDLNGFVTPQMFGLVFNAGNQTSVFNEFMTYLKGIGGRGYLEGGDYLVKYFDVSGATKSWRLDGAGSDTVNIISTDGNGTMINGGAGSVVPFDIGGFTLNAQYSVYKSGGATGGSGVSIADINNCTFYDINVIDYKNNAILVYANSGLLKNITFRSCKCDGNTVAGNGLLIVDCDNAQIIDCSAYNVLKTEGSGAGMGLQLKNDCNNSSIINGYAENCFVNIAFGFEGGVTGVENSIMSSCRSVGGTTGCRIHGRNNKIELIADMQSAGEHCVDLQSNAFRNEINIACKNVATSKGIVRFQTGAKENSCEVTGENIDTVGGSRYAVFETGSLDNYVTVEGVDRATLSSSGYRRVFNHQSTTSNCGKINGIYPTHTFLQISAGSITIDNPLYKMILVETEGATSTDDLTTINSGMTDGSVVIIRAVSGSRDVVVKNGTGNILTKSGLDVTLADRESSIQLQYLLSVNKYIEI